jgi:diguanylate cyclase
MESLPGGQAPPRPADEDARLADIRDLGVATSGPDAEIDALVDLAALIADARIGLLTVVEEDEQVFKSAVGIDAAGTPRDVSFCGHAIAAGTEPMIVPDARLDPRFADNPLVTGDPNVVFYLGVPVLTAQGHAVGTLCVVDDKPRELSNRQVAALVRLASQVAGIIEARGRLGVAERAQAPGDAEALDRDTGLPVREAMLESIRLSGGIPATACAVALRVDEIDAGGPRGGLLADGALAAVAHAIQGCLPDTARMARAFGQFVIVLPGADGVAGRALVATIRNRLRGAIVVEPRVSVHVGLTAGIATTSHALAIPADDLVAAAEDALQQADTFSTGILVLDDGIRGSRERTAIIRTGLATAITEGQLVVHYQPIVRLPGDEVVGVEALVRWRHPDLGLIMPDEFIPFAEDMGIIPEIDRYVMRRALHDLAAGHTQGSEVSVNVSPVSIREGLPGVVASDLRDARVLPSSLILELTERVRFDRDPDVIEVLQALGEVGVRLAIDDFGAGTTSLAHLRSLPVSRLKLDRSLITDLGGPDAQRAAMIVRTLRDLAGHLGVEVLAEGVEDEEQRDTLMREGISLAQGYLFGRPGPLREA